MRDESPVIDVSQETALVLAKQHLDVSTHFWIMLAPTSFHLLCSTPQHISAAQRHRQLRSREPTSSSVQAQATKVTAQATKVTKGYKLLYVSKVTRGYKHASDTYKSLDAGRP